MYSKWNTLIKRCIQQRVSLAKFLSYIQLLRKDESITGKDLCSLILQRAGLKAEGVDPLCLSYVEGLLDGSALQPHDVLQALLNVRSNADASEDHDAFADISHRLALEAALDSSLLIHLARGFSTDEPAQDNNQYKELFKALNAWMHAAAAQSEDVMVTTAAASSQEIMQCVSASRESFAIMLITCLANQHVVTYLGLEEAKDEAKPVAEALVFYLPLLEQTHEPHANRLQMMQRELVALQISDAAKLRQLEEGHPNVGQMRLESIIDPEPVNTRANFLVHLDGLLDGRPTASEAHVLGYLHTRYKGDAANATLDFITACFDVLAASVSRGDSMERLFLQRSFVTNKAPPLVLLLVSTGFVTVSTEVIISQALSRLEPSLFASFEQQPFLGGQINVLAETRQHFLAACVLNNVIPADSVGRIVGDLAQPSLPNEGLANRQQLIEECKSSAQKLEQLVDKTQAFDGNAAIRVEALSQIFHSTCESRDKAALKSLCNQISKRAHCIDAIALYTDIRTMLQPLCLLLTEWRQDEDEGEHQPVYDEFSACLLLLLAIFYRFKLTATELGFPIDSIFWQQLFQGNVGAMPINTLNEEQNKRLAGWISSLFESNSLGDEVLSSCPPQEFYLLAPTIFQQTIMACRLGALEAAHLKSGLELLLESFLMPALIPSFLWLVNNAQEHSDEDNIFVSILTKVVNPPSLNGDAAGMHATMLSILGDSLCSYLHDLKRRQPGRTGIDPLVEKLQQHTGYVRRSEASNDQIHAWNDGNPHGIIGSLRADFGALCFWSSNPAMQSPMPSFPPQLVRTAVKLKGARATLDGVVDEVNNQIATGLGDAALDIGTGIVVSSSIAGATSPTNYMTLRDVLQMDLANAAQVFADKDGNHLRTETCVRLSRRVETLLANISAASTEHEDQQAAMHIPMPDAMMGDIELDAATAAAVGLGGEDVVPEATSAVVSDALNFDAAGTGDLQMDIDAALAGQAQQQQQAQQVQGGGDQGQNEEVQLPQTEDDIFGDLMVDDYVF